jgi:hypothetical protein
MRTTLNIEDEAVAQLKKYAEERDISLGQAASDLIHRGIESLPKFKTKGGWVVFDLPPGSAPLTNELLDKWEAEDYEEEYQRAMSPRR